MYLKMLNDHRRGRYLLLFIQGLMSLSDNIVLTQFITYKSERSLIIERYCGTESSEIHTEVVG